MKFYTKASVSQYWWAGQLMTLAVIVQQAGTQMLTSARQLNLDFMRGHICEMHEAQLTPKSFLKQAVFCWSVW